MKRRARVGAGAAASAIALVLTATGCSAGAKVTTTMNDTVRQVRDRVAAVARGSSSPSDLNRRVRAGEAYTLLLLGADAEDIRSTEPFPSTAITALRSDGDRLEVELFTTGQGSRQTGWFGEESINLVGCALVIAEPGGGASARGTNCGGAVREVFREPWEQVRLRP